MAKDESNVGVVTALVMGVGALILLILVVFIVVGTIDDADLLQSTATTTTNTETAMFLNASGDTIADFSTDNRAYAISSVVNGTGGAVTSGNYVFDATTGILTNGSALDWLDVNVTYTYIAPTDYETTSDGMTRNFTTGVDNVSSKIPTILLIGAVVLLFGVIVLLVRQSQAMGIGGTSSGSL